MTVSLEGKFERIANSYQVCFGKRVHVTDCQWSGGSKSVKSINADINHKHFLTDKKLN